METAEVQEMQHAWRWPLGAMACSSGRCCLQLEWDPQLIRYFGGLGVLGVAGGGNPDDHGAIEHELGLFFPKCMEWQGSSEPPREDVMEWSEEQLEELIRVSNFPILDEDLVGFDPSCILEDTSTAADASFLCKNSNGLMIFWPRALPHRWSRPHCRWRSGSSLPSARPRPIATATNGARSLAPTVRPNARRHKKKQSRMEGAARGAGRQGRRWCARSRW
uniref:Uncharacterized protein n=1 Tax=Aegilops tauschii subsp. strangulata TaxID=200361 RepID=A0A452YPN6_AEGTS